MYMINVLLESKYVLNIYNKDILNLESIQLNIIINALQSLE